MLIPLASLAVLVTACATGCTAFIALDHLPIN